MALTVIFDVSNAQEKYAVLITGDYAAAGIPQEQQWDPGGDSPKVEFWYDTYLIWEMLVFEKGYSNENVFVLFADGVDYSIVNPNIWERYTAAYHGLDYITNYSATITNVEDVFNGLATGTGGFPQVTEDDFLFVWTFDHGDGDIDAFLCLMDEEIMWDYEFAELTDPIAAHKKVFWMQQCHSGGFYDDLEAINTVFHSACQPDEVARPADNLTVSGVPVDEWDFYYSGDPYYRHGEFNFHLYSAMVGESPAYVDNYNGQPYIEADENNDKYISVLESYNWEDTHESIEPSGIWYGEDPLYSDIGNIGANTSLDYPTLLFADIGGDGMTVSYRGLIGISKDIHVTSGNQLSFIANANVYLLNESKLIIDEGASLVLGDNVTLVGVNSNNQLVINGGLEVGNNVTFSSEGPSWYLYLSNHSLVTVFNNTTFEKCELHSYAENLTISNSTFDDCFMANSHRGIINVTNTVFDRTCLFLENIEDNQNTATVSGCNFTTDLEMAAIDLLNYNNYEILENTIEGHYNGIQILQSGYGKIKNQMISDNTITNCTQCGILAYGTVGDIYKNHISNNKYGVWLGDHSSIRLYGYSGANTNSQTQEINDNESYEVYATQYSFPKYFHYNAIIDDDNIGGEEDALVYYNEGTGGMTLKDVRYNCWEVITGSFDYSEDLYPNGYIWEPTWCPDNGSGSSTDPDEDMYETANNLFDAEDYTGAKSMYEMLINQYPQSKFAKAAMQELFALEKYVSNDYNSLKQYYTTNTTIQVEPVLSENGEYMASKCDIKLENWPEAISYYENIILAPETMEDSIFAIIDLGYVYFVMENSGYKSAYTGNLIEYKPESKERFIENRNYLLSLIPGDQMSGTMKANIAELKEGELLQNVPNPFKGSTQVWYKINTESNVQLNIYNYTGQLIKSIDEGTKTKGTHYIDFNANGLKNGIYFYSISINGQTSDSRKMTVMK